MSGGYNIDNNDILCKGVTKSGCKEALTLDIVRCNNHTHNGDIEFLAGFFNGSKFSKKEILENVYKISEKELVFTFWNFITYTAPIWRSFEDELQGIYNEASNKKWEAINEKV